MIKLLKAIVILVLVCMIASGGYAAYYFIVQKPKEQDAAETVAAGVVGAPTPDPTTGEFEKIRDLRRNQQYPEARLAAAAFLTRFPDSTHHDEAEAMIGELNLMDLMSGDPAPGKDEYVVQRGDILDRVAHKTGCNPELIYQANGLEHTMLHIGQKLRIPQVDFAVEIHLKIHRLLLLNHGHFFKAYVIQSEKDPGKRFPEIHTKVQEKQATRDNKRVAFGTREYQGSTRALTLTGQPAYTIYGEDDVPDAKQTGIGLQPSDAEELHTLLNVGSPVTINEN